MAIIGTAGRKEDEARLTHNHWLTMVKAGIDLFLGEKFDMLVSGGAAWADHVAVQMTDYEIYGYGTEIWLPANERDLDIARWYHSKFSKVVGFDTREQINRCYREGKLTIQKHGGFKDRNTKVAEIASHFLAFTFGDGPKVKDGGTADTVRKMQNRGVTGWHYDLNTLTLHKIP